MKSPSSPLPFYRSFDMSFIQFRLETVQRFFHNAVGGANGIPYGRIYAYFSKIRQTLRRNAGFASQPSAPLVPGLFFNSRVIQFLYTGRQPIQISNNDPASLSMPRVSYTHGIRTFAITVQDTDSEKSKVTRTASRRQTKFYIHEKYQSLDVEKTPDC